MAGTFISYRREDAAGYAGRLRESLERRLGAARVFRDVDTLRPGQDFVQAIESRLADCRVMLAVIGREWVDARDIAGDRRLDEPNDFVRLEITAALARPSVLVIPVLVEGVSMPSATSLPEPLKPLARRQAVSLRDETWDADVGRLVTVIEEASGDTGRADAPIPGTRLWVAAGLAVVIIGLLLFNGRRADRGRGGIPGENNGAAAEPGAPAAGVAGGAAATRGGGRPSGAARGAPYTIDIPRVAEAAFGHVVYSVASGNVVMRDDTNELRLRVRVMNEGRNDVNFWDDSFRLALGGGNVLSPTSGLNSVVPGHSLRYGIVTFRIPPRARVGTLRVATGQDTAQIPLDLSSTGRPPVDEQAEIADSLGQAVTSGVVRDPEPLIDAGGVAVTLQRASTRRFANTLRLRLSIRMVNHGRFPVHTGAVTMRVAAGSEVVAPFEFPNQSLDPMGTTADTVLFDLPTTTTKAVLRTTVGDLTMERALALQ
jgi:hypothetical protein